MLIGVVRSIGRFHPMRTLRGMALAVLCGVGIFGNPVAVHCQSGCGPVEYNVTAPPPDGFFTVLQPSVCRDDGVVANDQNLPNGGFLALNKMFRVDTAAHVTGTCDVYTWDWWYWYCHYWWTEIRTLLRVTLWFIPPTQPAWYQYAPAAYQATSLDTRGGPGFELSLTELGRHRFTFQSNAYNTSCTPPIDSAITEMAINAVACSPVWNLIGNPAQTIHLPANAVFLYVLPDMWDRLVGTLDNPGPVRRAVDDWNAQLAGTGVNIQIVNYDCGTGGDCIDLQVGDVPPDACAQFIRGTAPVGTGEIGSASTIVIPTNWASKTDDRLRRTIGHELGHPLGLGHNGCSTSDSIMSIPQGVTADVACSSITGLTLSPTSTDVTPTVSSTYGNHVRRVCGF